MFPLVVLNPDADKIRENSASFLDGLSAYFRALGVAKTVVTKANVFGNIILSTNEALQTGDPVKAYSVMGISLGSMVAVDAAIEIFGNYPVDVPRPKV